MVGYSWDLAKCRGTLDIMYADETTTALYNEDSMQDLAVETYALRLCAGRGVCELMASEMRTLHHRACDMFNGVNGLAIRDSKVLSSLLGARPTDEDALVPLLDIANSEVSNVQVRYMLAFVYYHEGGRDPPASVSLSASIFDVPSSPMPERNICLRATVLCRSLLIGLMIV